LRKRTKLLSLSAGVVVAATVAIAPAFGDNVQQNFVLISDDQIYGHDVQVNIQETDTDGTVHQVSHDFDGGNPKTLYWLIDSNATQVYVEGGRHEYTFVPPAPGQPSPLPACFRISNSGKLHQVLGNCNTDGGQQAQWTS